MQKPSLPIGGEALRPQARTEDLVTRELADEDLVYDLETHQAHCLNKTAAAVWKQCDGNKTTEEIATLLQQETNMLVSSAMVKVALHQLGRANLLKQRVEFSAEKPSQLRREVLRQIGLGAAAALPLVTSIIAPLTAQAMSCGDPNNNTNQNAVGCSCQSNNDCDNNCCGFGNICANFGSVPNGSPCRVNCECAVGLTCKGSPQRCLP